MSSEQQILNLIAQYTHYVDQAKFDKGIYYLGSGQSP